MNKFLENLKRQAEENPIGALVVSSIVMTAASKLIKSYGETSGSRAYAKQVNYRIKNRRP
jgi:hypothetical protein